jgi:hypothetical protein
MASASVAAATITQTSVKCQIVNADTNAVVSQIPGVHAAADPGSTYNDMFSTTVGVTDTTHISVRCSANGSSATVTNRTLFVVPLGQPG